ncbi:hypothetical protein PHYBOEH_011141 [Phytophthora boehmeriae]|uniref:Uncharacterized protein n=1 Tax=Phytophthora boehmeriae TaxID=109152 RepID=A0A8T1X3E2_9STRA|nr:hypothetical protein PHYBOEH_011141 [Phytophthora boehmeriae]
MPGERRHGTATQEELGVNWKSALCVTSLYDSYIQLQRENEELREAARRLQQENEVLAVKKEAQDKELQLRVPEDAEMKQEMRLLRSEKQRMEETHRHQVQKLEARAATSETAHQQLLSKYQEKFSLDPLEAKRAALAVKTMQNSLHNAVVEKEELGVRYMELKEQFLKFQSDQRQLVHNLHEQLRVFEEHRLHNVYKESANGLSWYKLSCE